MVFGRPTPRLTGFRALVDKVGILLRGEIQRFESQGRVILEGKLDGKILLGVKRIPIQYEPSIQRILY